MQTHASTDFYKKFDELFVGMENLLNNYKRSEILQRFLMDQFESHIHANLINLFFINLNRKNVKELELPSGKIGQIKRKYRNLRQEARLSLCSPFKHKKITAQHYSNFKSTLKEDFPNFQKLVHEIEKTIGFKKAKKYLEEKSEKIKKSGKITNDLNDIFITKILEIYVLKKKCFPVGKQTTKLIGTILKEAISPFSKKIRITLNENSKKMLDYQRNIMKNFEDSLYKRWKVPLDLLECLIHITSESAEKHRTKFGKMPDAKSNLKFGALLQIHARALQISNEIMVLLRSGYADGANSRWRSLHELAVISFFLGQNSNDVSKRYLEHEIVRKFKEAKDYNANCRKLGYPPISRKEFNLLRREKERLCTKYVDDFEKDYGWIPSSLLRRRDFRALEDNVKLGKLHPYYNLACDSVHGGSKGFYRLGLKPEQQKKLLLVGPSGYGLADPIQNTAISLAQITVCLLGLLPDVENIVAMQVIHSYVEDIKIGAIKVHEAIEKEN